MERASSQRVALVTGATRGIGRQVATRLAERGDQVHLVGRDASALGEVAAQLGARAAAHPLDVRDEEAVRSLAQAIRGAHGGLDLLVNNAGIMIPGTVAEYSTADFVGLMRTNLLGPFLFMRECLPLLAGRKGATIVNVASLAPTVANPGLGAYAASKAALIALSDALREEVREQGVRVAVILPGSTRTALFGPESAPGPEDDWMLDPDDVARAVLTIHEADPRALFSRVELRPVRRRQREHPPRR